MRPSFARYSPSCPESKRSASRNCASATCSGRINRGNLPLSIAASGDGEDSLYGNAGDDVLDGGAGADNHSFHAAG
ncbi:MAG: hypothetical protein LBV36_09085 [Chromatiales bacterium]|nr:hypothetical protein [Chromatiales bacterium]